jgi:transposase
MLRRRQFRPGEKGGPAVGKTKRGKGTKWMVVVDGTGTPLGAHLDSASPHEVTLLERTLATIAVPRAHTPGRPRQRPDRLIADRAYDSNPLRARLAQRGIEPIIPALSNHPNATHQDGRKLRRYRHRWIVERTFSWLGTFRRLVVRYERLLVTYAGFFHLACAMLVLRRVMK